MGKTSVLKKYIILAFSCLSCLSTQGQDSLQVDSLYYIPDKGLKFSSQQIILPASLALIGTYLAIDGSLDKKISEKIIEKDFKKTRIDDFLLFGPGATVYALGFAGIKGKHNFVDKTVIYGTASFLAFASSESLKSITGVERPDHSANNSFPSGHTALAFAGAEFLRQEYKDQSIWYGIAGYSMASCTGLMRIYNNRHWSSDILVGAGVGIISTKISYWIHPQLSKLYKRKSSLQALVLPYYTPYDCGISMSATF
ncbi:hypothetical protein AwDysgo_02730 [Bacteroidales bacterium]|nr:hypothetical protein AwDysgo_02730 [Bacteroidales bacterium]